MVTAVDGSQRRISVEPVTHVRADIGECPVWDEESNAVWWIDALAGLLHRTDLATGRTETNSLGQALGAVVLRSDGGVALAAQQGFAILVGGKLDVIVPIDHGATRGRMNDGKCDAAGRFWAGAMEYDAKSGLGALYRLDGDLSLHRVLSGLTLPNGLGWSPDGRTLYHTDSIARTIRAFACDPETGSLGSGRVIVELGTDDGLPDGLAVDVEGGLWSATWGASEVRRYMPDGRVDVKVQIPALNPTSCAFGGPGLRTLFISSAARGCHKDGRPHNGALFACEPGVAGLRVGTYLRS